MFKFDAHELNISIPSPQFPSDNINKNNNSMSNNNNISNNNISNNNISVSSHKRKLSRSPSMGETSLFLLNASHGQNILSPNIHHIRKHSSFDDSLRAQSPFSPIYPASPFTPDSQIRKSFFASVDNNIYTPSTNNNSFASPTNQTNSGYMTPQNSIQRNQFTFLTPINNNNNNNNENNENNNQENSFTTPPISGVMPTPDLNAFDPSLDISNIQQKYDTPAAPSRNRYRLIRRKNSLYEKKELFSFVTNDEQTFEDQFHMQQVGEGAFFFVYKAIRKSDGLLFAVKKSKQLFTSKTDRAQYLNEIKAVSLFERHANIVGYYRAWQQDLHFFIQMEFCQCSLRDLINRNQINNELIWKVLIDTCNALVRIHGGNVLHLDIKPDNILLGQDGINFKLGDFGQAILREHWTDGKEGDRRYMAPELLDNFHKPSTAADMFSLGCLIFEIASGIQLPHNGPNWHNLRNNHFNSLLNNFNIKLDDNLLIILSGLLKSDPNQRPSAISIVNQLSNNMSSVQFIPPACYSVKE